MTPDERRELEELEIDYAVMQHEENEEIREAEENLCEDCQYNDGMCLNPEGCDYESEQVDSMTRGEVVEMIEKEEAKVKFEEELLKNIIEVARPK